MKTLLLLLLLILPHWLFSQQISDANYNPNIKKPAYETGKGPVVFIDEGHHNFHTKEGRYKPFANLIERDGYVVKSYEGAFNRNKLDGGKILVVSNALNEVNVGNWNLPTPSAFTADEIALAKQWVQDGGSLFLIADHMPMAGAATDLAAAFGFEFTNGFAMQEGNSDADFFNLEKGTLVESALTKGRDASERVKQVASFTGQAFKIPEDATPVLLFDDQYTNYLPDAAWVFNEKTPQYKVKGWAQGAFKAHGKGRIVVFGEAAMFSAQLAGPDQMKVGMNSEDAPENFQLLLNIIHWLDGGIE